MFFKAPWINFVFYERHLNVPSVDCRSFNSHFQRTKTKNMKKLNGTQPKMFIFQSTEILVSQRSSVCPAHLLTADVCQVYSFLSSKFLGQWTDEHATFPGSRGGGSCHSWTGCWSSRDGSLEIKYKVIRNLKLSSDKNYGAKYLDIFQCKLCLTGAGAETSATPVST